jgi:Ca-activated chloride channel homolog
VYDAVYRTVAERFQHVDGRKALILISDGEDTTSRSYGYDDAVNVVTESDVLVYGLRFAGTDGNIQINPWPRSPVPNIPLPFPWPFPRRKRGPFTSGHLLPQPNSAAGQWPRRNRGDFMTDITTAGGGPVFDAQTINDYRDLAIKIAEELRHVYVVSYYPSNPLSNGGYRAIRLRVKSRDDIAVRHRKGYNAKDMVKGN